ncbi:AraC family transcriptional regulator [Segniliparus rugosus]|uniref:HTH-type transcriptional regulator RipA n=1 Tax=Segniliparus rugosus (strain ATCC BAA-974 / DSM 45345 / CCUG 50838 / CIP 108380 / JCM 13579 / CDC 945) TaxID=679197 RepID=E5XUV3_SEGRC|nr:helix-turn-helix transcriptional regulator [Segniliparus rugosus]EFV11789.1 hypothetical protein HMPREF9336_03275 [Segniliparus rugosus ATCC BAA-974]
MSDYSQDRVATSANLHEAGERIARHRHRKHQIVYSSRGAVAVTTPKGTWIAPKDRAVWIPANTWHEHRFYGNTQFHGVAFDPSDCGDDRPRPAVVTVTPLLRELIIACSESERLAHDEAARLRAVLLDQLRHCPEIPLSLAAPQDPRLLRALEIIETSLADPISLDKLAARIGMGERTLSRAIRAELGMSYPQWRAQIRLFHATIHLAKGSSVTETAVRCGWATPSAFIDAYRQAFGRTPGSRTGRETSSV